MSWFEANKFCKNIGAKLVEINSEEENAAIVDEINKRKFQEKKMYFWIGLTDLRKEGVWKLESNGATANYQNWDESYKDNPEPNNHGGNEDCASELVLAHVGETPGLICNVGSLPSTLRPATRTIRFQNQRRGSP